MRYPPHILEEIRSPAAGFGGGGEACAPEEGGAGMAGAVAVQRGEDAVLLRQRPEAVLPLLFVRQARRHLHFLMETEGLSFPEAVERLAAEAGVALPKMTREDQEQEVKRSSSLRRDGAGCRVLRGLPAGPLRAQGPRLSRRARPRARRPKRGSVSATRRRSATPCAIIWPAKGVPDRHDGRGGAPRHRRGRQGSLRPLSRPGDVPDLATCAAGSSPSAAGP